MFSQFNVLYITEHINVLNVIITFWRLLRSNLAATVFLVV